MRGNITRRGKSSWRIKFDVGTDETESESFSTKLFAAPRLRHRPRWRNGSRSFAEGRYVAPTAETVGAYAKHWIENIAPASRAPISVDRYATIIRVHIIPALGHIELQKLDGTAIDKFYASRRDKADMRGGKFMPCCG